MVGVTVIVGTLEVGLLVNVAGSGVADGKGVNVNVGELAGVWDGNDVGVWVQVGGRTTGLPWVGINRVGVLPGALEQANRSRKMADK